MLRRRLISALPLLLLAAPGVARTEAAAKKDPGQAVDLQPVGMPIVVNGELVNYVFVKLRLDLAPWADPLTYRPKEPFFRDALVLAAFRHPFVRADDLSKVDIVALKRTMLQLAVGVAGPRVVTGVELVGDPSPQRITGLPRTSPAKRVLIP